MVATTDSAAARLVTVGLVALCLTGVPAVAGSQTEPQDQPDAESETAADTLGGISPRNAMLRSAILPGWGQYSNHRPFKSLLFAAAAAASLSSGIAEVGSLDRAVTPEEHQDRAARRNTRFLLFAVTATLAAVDAYVDAHLADLDAIDLEVGFPSVHPGTDRGTMSAMVRARIRLPH